MIKYALHHTIWKLGRVNTGSLCLYSTHTCPTWSPARVHHQPTLASMETEDKNVLAPLGRVGWHVTNKTKWRCTSWPHWATARVDVRHFPPSSHPLQNTTARTVISEKQKSSTVYSRLLEGKPTCCVQSTAMLIHSTGGRVIAFVSTSVQSNCCTAKTATFPDGMAHSGLTPEPISLQPAATSVVGNILITHRMLWTVDTYELCKLN